MPVKEKKLLIFDFNGTLEGRGKLYPGVGDMLKKLHESGEYAMAIVSNGDSRSIKKILQRESDEACAKGTVNYEQYFDVIMGAAEIAKANKGVTDKTNPKVVDAILEECSYHLKENETINPHNGAVIGDSWSEHLLAKRNGMGFVYAGWHDIANNEPVKSGLMLIPASEDSGNIGITKNDISEAFTAERVSELPEKINKLLNRRDVTSDLTPGKPRNDGPDI